MTNSEAEYRAFLRKVLAPLKKKPDKQALARKMTSRWWAAFFWDEEGEVGDIRRD